MTIITRFTIHVDKNWGVTIDADGAGNDWPLTRQLRTIKGNNLTFPRPPADDLPAPEADWFPLCEGPVGPVQDALDNIKLRSLTGGVIERFGRYLFQTLIGSNWSAMLALANAQGVQAIDLALSWDQEVNDLHRLNWEMMHDGNGFLAAMHPPTVAVTRLVSRPDQDLTVIELPPRILFVVGSSLSDPDIQPGYEIYSLLHNLKLGGRSVNSRLLERAKPSVLAAVIDSFEPHVVHFICHGGIDQHSRGFLKLELDEKETEQARFAAQLLQYLRGEKGEKPLPPMVVLSACHSGNLLGPSETGPLAAELVAGGVPVVIGMAGRVSDLACRLFTRRFGDALVQGLPLVLATAQGRRFAFGHGHAPDTSVDWAFPTLFTSTQVTADYAPSTAVKVGAKSAADGWIAAFDLERANEPVFCNRNDCFTAYYKLLQGKPVLIVRGERSMGKSRLIRELAARAIRDGHVPIMISSDEPLWDPPKTMEDLRKELIRAIFKACEIFGLIPAAAQLIALGQPEGSQLDATLKAYLDVEGKVTTKILLKALGIDLNEMMARAEAAPQFTEGAVHRPIVLLDQIHLYDQEFLKNLDQALGKGGLGYSEENPIPLILAFEPTAAADKVITLTESKRTWLTVLDLEPFSREKDQDLMAYRRVLLNPFNRELFPNVSDKAFAVNPEAAPTDVGEWFDVVRNVLDGRPGRLIENTLYGFARLAKDQEVLLEGDDLVLLEQLREVGDE